MCAVSLSGAASVRDSEYVDQVPVIVAGSWLLDDVETVARHRLTRRCQFSGQGRVPLLAEELAQEVPVAAYRDP